MKMFGYNWRGTLEDVENMHLRRFSAVFAALLVMAFAGPAQSLLPGVQMVTSIEGARSTPFPTGCRCCCFQMTPSPRSR